MHTTTNTFKRIAINTGGGDAPGLNAVIHAAVHAAHNQRWEIHGAAYGVAPIGRVAQTVIFSTEVTWGRV